MSYFLSPALAKLRDQINAKWPRRDKASDGWIGDTSHAARPSDHNPDWSDGGIVRAIDVDKDGIDVDQLLRTVLADSRTCYVIWNRRLWAWDTRAWRAYTGSNPHDKHVHISIRSDGGRDRDARSWALGSTTTTPAKTTQEEDMASGLDATQAKQLSTVHHILTAPIIGDIDGKQTVESALFRLLVLARRTAGQNLDVAVARGVKKAVASTPGVDEAALTKGVVAEVRKALADVSGTEYVLTPKES